MDVPFVDLRAQYRAIYQDINEVFNRVLKDARFIGGPIISEFEEAFSQFAGVDHTITCANGTDALEIALEALKIGQGDEVIVPSYSWKSTASAVVRVGAHPVFVDVDPDYYSIDPNLLEAKISRHTKAIIPVHFYGLPANMPEIMTLARKHGLMVIEDCAQAHGAAINEQAIGTFGDLGTFSFFPSKNLGAYGDAGALVTNDHSLAERIRIISRLGQKEKHHHVEIGRNSRMDVLQAAILSAKLPHLKEWIARRRFVARSYRLAFADDDIKMQRIPDNFRHVYHLFVIQVNKRDQLKEYLADRGVTTQIHYPQPLTMLKPFHTDGKYPVAEEMSKRILSLPVYPELTDDQIQYVIRNVKTFFKTKK